MLAAMTDRPTVELLPPLSPRTLCAVLAMIQPDRVWRTKAKVVGLVGSRPGGDYWGGPNVANLVGISDGRARVILKELARDRVIWRDGGPKIYWCELNPNVLGWLQVPWVEGVNHLELRRRLAEHHSQAFLDPAERLSARPLHKRCHIASARLTTTDRTAEQGDSEAYARAKGPRDQGPEGGGGSRAYHARSGSNVRPLKPRSQSSRAPQEEVPSWLSDDESSPPADELGAGGEAELDAFIIDRGCDIVRRLALAGPGGRKFISDPVRSRVATLMGRYGAEAFIEAAKAVAGQGQQIPYLLNDVATYLAAQAAGDHDGSDVLDGLTADATEQRARLSARLGVLRALSGVYDGQAEQDRLSELLACENALRALDEQEGVA